MGKSCGQLCCIICSVLGVITTLFSFAMLVGGYQAMYDAILKKNLEIVPGSRAEEIWMSPPVNMIMLVYFFNITNADEFLNGEKPIVVEVGPYAYREFHQKEVKYHPNMTVTYNQTRWWTFDQEISGENHLDDVLTVLNTVPVSAAYSVENSKIVLSSLNVQLELLNEQAIVQATAQEILFDGYEDPLLDLVQALVGDGDGSHLPFPPGLTDYDKFAWFYNRNNSPTYDGIFNMFTGESTSDVVGMIDLYDRSNTTDYFYEPCNTVNGSAGEMWPPGLQRDYIQFYSSDLCMSAKLYYQKDIEDSYGFPGYRYWGSNMTFANVTYAPENECYCINGVCSPNGLLDAQTCRMGSPAYISFPHFMNADPALLEQVDGLSPDSDRHAFFIDINPDLGVPLRVAARMQINMGVKPYPGDRFGLGKIDILANVPDVILPMMWFEVVTRMTEELADEMRPAIVMSSALPFIVFGVILAIGLVETVVSFLYLYRRNKSPKASVGCCGKS